MGDHHRKNGSPSHNDGRGLEGGGSNLRLEIDWVEDKYVYKQVIRWKNRRRKGCDLERGSLNLGSINQIAILLLKVYLTQ